MPLVRKIFGKLLANEIVSVQPMSLPSGLVFYVDFTFGTTSTTDKDIRTSGESVYGNTSSSGQPTGGYYGGVNYSYSKNFLSGNLGPTFATSTVGSPTVPTSLNVAINAGYYVSASWADVDYDPNFSASVAGVASTIKKVVVPIASMSNIDETLARAVQIYSNGVGGANTVYRKFTKYLPTGDAYITIPAISFITSGSPSPSNTSINVTASWLRKTTQDFRGDFEIGQTGVGADPIPELNILVRSKAVVAQTRKMKTIWTPELQQDLSAYHDIDAEAELTTMLSEQLSLEIDREVLDNLLANGQQTNPFFWSLNIGTWVDQSGATIPGTGTFYGTQQEWYQELVSTVTQASNRIHKKTLRGAANFMVTSPEIASILESTLTFKPVMTLDEQEVKYSMGIEKVGTLGGGRWTVYKDPYFQTNKILLGFRGTSFLEAGYVYSPYVPLLLTPTVLNPTTFTPTKGIMTRYGRTTTRPEFYACITVRDLRVASQA
jgi:hypothetical protein